jgi:DNA-directed RNA polymerase subunit omega
MLMKPKIDELLEHTDSRFTLAIAAAKRARQINNYYRHLGEGLGYDAPPQVQSASNKPLTIALEELAQDKLECERLAEGIK